MNTTAHRQLDEAAVQHVSEFFRALSDPMRLRILDELRGAGPASVGELTQRLGSSQANVSKHLSTLAQRGLVERETQGTKTIYRIGEDIAAPLCELVCEHVAQRLQAAALAGARLSRRGPGAQDETDD